MHTGIKIWKLSTYSKPHINEDLGLNLVCDDEKKNLQFGMLV